MDKPIEYSEKLTNEEYLSCFKCCKNCSNWIVDDTLQGDYAYNGCSFWQKQGKEFLTQWSIFCNEYDGEKIHEAPNHKTILSGDKLVLDKRRA